MLMLVMVFWNVAQKILKVFGIKSDDPFNVDVDSKKTEAADEDADADAK